MTKIRVRTILQWQALLTVACSVSLMFLAPSTVMSFLAGAILMAINFVLLATLWSRIFDKKPVATTIGIIVTKYAILVILLYYLFAVVKVPIMPFVAGTVTLLGSFVLSIIGKQNAL